MRRRPKRREPLRLLKETHPAKLHTYPLQAAERKPMARIAA